MKHGYVYLSDLVTEQRQTSPEMTKIESQLMVEGRWVSP